MKNATLLLLIKRGSNSNIDSVLLAMKKRGFGVGKWNGTGGKVNEEESIEEATVREALEEIGVTVRLRDLRKVADFDYLFPLNPNFEGLRVHIFCTEVWEGEPAESEEMAPAWFLLEEIPYKEMWTDDIHWMPRVFAGECLKGSFSFDEQDNILHQTLTAVASF